jgi:hypothetical protein
MHLVHQLICFIYDTGLKCVLAVKTDKMPQFSWRQNENILLLGIVFKMVSTRLRCYKSLFSSKSAEVRAFLSSGQSVYHYGRSYGLGKRVKHSCHLSSEIKSGNDNEDSSIFINTFPQSIKRWEHVR